MHHADVNYRPDQLAHAASGLTGDMRSVIRTRLAAGESDSRILDEFMASYGDSILTEPPKRGVSVGCGSVPSRRSRWECPTFAYLSARGDGQLVGVLVENGIVVNTTLTSFQAQVR